MLFDDFIMQPKSWIKPFVVDIQQALGDDNPNASIRVTLPETDEKEEVIDNNWFRKLTN